jgi:hypothetical protein
VSEEPSRAADPSRRLRLIWIAGLWIAAIGLFLGKQIWMDWLIRNRENWSRGSGDILLPSGDWWILGTFGPFAFAATALLIQGFSFRGFKRDVSGCGLFVLIPVVVLVYLVAPHHNPRTISSAQLTDGRHFVLARSDYFKGGHSYALYEPTGPLGSYWRVAGGVEYSMHDLPREARRLVVSTDQQWLLVAGPDIWVACFYVARGGFRDCDELDHRTWEERMREVGFGPRTRRIAGLTGLRPPARDQVE